MKALTIAGDGTPVVTTAYLRSKPTCNCSAQGLANCPHRREYSQPDCDSGWDSARERYFNGYHLYMLAAANSKHDLPLYPRLQPASRHDAVSLVVSSIEFAQRFTLGTIDKILLDAAHDAEAIYALLDHQRIEPFIDLNNRSKKNTTTDSDIQISPEGVPICPIGKEMKPNGYDHTQNRQKWRCPLACGMQNTCPTPCSTAKYGRTFHTFKADNLRIPPPKDEHSFKCCRNPPTKYNASDFVRSAWDPEGGGGRTKNPFLNVELKENGGRLRIPDENESRSSSNTSGRLMMILMIQFHHRGFRIQCSRGGRGVTGRTFAKQHLVTSQQIDEIDKELSKSLGSRP
ncbi:hypothetical protein [Paenibacillus periandrae]|uniref:hypothetical protein n=1 Tax=Paenibacillus periandrae TaxID=1761741 RepID=UPI001F08EC33|nr:hypothetical protein [Paenibacillus periandrae]